MDVCSKDVVVLLTVYNRPSVKSTIESVLNQTFKDYQLLIIDNASDDGTYEIMQEYAAKDERIVLVRNERNMGQTYSLHRGMSLIKGKYIARIDADDLMLPTRLEKQYNFLEQNPEYAVCGSWVQFITDDDRLGPVIRNCTTNEGVNVIQHIKCGFAHPAIMMRKETLDKYGLGYDKMYKMAEDYDLWRQILLHAKGTNLGEVLTLYRRGDNNDSEKNRSITDDEAYAVRKQIIENDLDGKSKRRMIHLLKIEEKERKSLVTAIYAYVLYKKYVRDSLDKNNPDYSFICKGIPFTILGAYVQQNSALWAKLVGSAYRRLRKRIYKRYR